MNQTLDKRAITPRRHEIRKRLNEAIEAVDKEYVEGCIAWYDESPTSEWNRVFEAMEKSLIQDSDSLVMRKIDWFEKTIVGLIQPYKKLKAKAEQMGLNL